MAAKLRLGQQGDRSPYTIERILVLDDIQAVTQVREIEVGPDGDVYVLHNFNGVGAFEVGCFQSVSDVVIQKSIREGFGLVVTEALWKGKPVIGGNAGGIPLQIIDGETGFLVDSVEECAQRTLTLLEHPEEAKKMGRAAKEHVRANFLTTRHLTDYLGLFHDMMA